MLRLLPLIILLFIFSISRPLQAQDTAVFSVYFDTDEDAQFDQSPIQSLIKTLNGDTIRVEKVVGHADNRGSEGYNQTLAQRRAESVLAFLSGPLNMKIEGEASSMGEKEAGTSNDDNSLKTDRRVDIFYTLIPKKQPLPKPEPKPIVKKEVPAEEVIALDTAENRQVVLKGLSFIPGRHYPTPASMPTLLKLVNTMKLNPTLEIEIRGYICCSYDTKDGMDTDTGEPFLSRNRAQFVYDFLIENGIDKERMSYVGLGSTEPKVFPEVTDADRQANRRVEIKVKKS